MSNEKQPEWSDLGEVANGIIGKLYAAYDKQKLSDDDKLVKLYDYLDFYYQELDKSKNNEETTYILEELGYQLGVRIQILCLTRIQELKEN